MDRGIHARYGPWALVAGASQGLGAAFAKAAASHGLNTILVARRADALEDVAAELKRDHAVQTRQIVQDMAEPDAASRLFEATRDLEVGMVIASAAGYPLGPFLEVPLEKHLEAIHTNCAAPLALAHHFGAPMVARKRGSIVIVSSLGGLAGLPLYSSYGATKAFDWNLGECLWEEFARDGVDALSYIVGTTLTPGVEASTTEAFRQNAATTTEVAERLFSLLDQGPTQCSTPDVEKEARALLTMSRKDAVTFFGQQNRTVFTPGG